MIILIAAIVLSLGAAWGVNALVGAMMGERPGGLFSDWWDIFSGSARSRETLVESLLKVPKFRSFSVGDKIRMPLIPIDLERSMTPERRELFRRSSGKILRVEGVDEFGVLELHVLDDGSQSPDRFHHILFIEPQYVESVAGAPSKPLV